MKTEKEKIYSYEIYEKENFRNIKRDAEKPIVFEPVIEHDDEVFKPVSTSIIQTVLPIYSVSNYGRVFDTYHGNYLEPGKLAHKRGRRLKNPNAKSPNGVEENANHVDMLSDISKDKQYRLKKIPVKNLVAAEFLQTTRENPFDRCYVTHISDDVCDDRASNLKYMKKDLHSGDTKPKSTLTEEEAAEIYDLVRKGYLSKEIYAKTGYPIKDIEDIRCGRTYKHLRNKYVYYSVINDQYVSNPLPESKVRKVCKLLEQNKSIIEVSYATGVSVEVVYPILARMQYLDISKDYKWD